MSSTSSSECMCDQYWPNYDTGYSTNFRNAYGGNPYYSAMGHPLIYYAQTPQPRNLVHRGRDRERGSPNCFVKAFRWYTKEHRPTRSHSPVKPDMTGFAAWLDIKYDKFLQDSQLGSDMYHLKLKQTFEAERVPTDSYCEPGAKRFPASPSKKKRRARSSETGTARQKSNQSCRYIMQPKDMSRPPSVCCHLSNCTTIASECPNKPITRSQSFSNTTLVIKSKEPCIETPAVGDTKSKINVSQNSKRSTEKIEISTKNKTTENKDYGCQFADEITTKVNAETQYDVAVPQNVRRGSHPSNEWQRLDDCECSPEKKMIQKSPSRGATICQPVLPCELNPGDCACKSLDTMPRKSITMNRAPENSSRLSQKRMKSKSYSNVECQCPEEKVVNVDALTQYMPCPTNYENTNICECDLKGFTRNIQAPVQSLPIQSNYVPMCACERKVNEEIATERVKFVQSTSQTSNYSICLAKETIHKYPLFLKIVCADKLSNENMK